MGGAFSEARSSSIAHGVLPVSPKTSDDDKGGRDDKEMMAMGEKRKMKKLRKNI